MQFYMTQQVNLWWGYGYFVEPHMPFIISSAHCRMNGSSALTFNVSLYTHTRYYQPPPPPLPLHPCLCCSEYLSGVVALLNVAVHC